MLDDWNSEWFFEKARAYPLLEKSEEHAIDATKWRALHDIPQLLAQDQAGQCYLRQWASNLLHNPPDLDKFTNRKHYFTLRREHKSIVGHDESIAIVESLADGRLDSLDTKDACRQLLQGSLISIGMAKVLLGAAGSNEVSAALAYWQRYWSEAPSGSDDELQPGSVIALRRCVDDYFDARSRLINHNLRLVFSVARKLEGRRSFEDLTQDGFVGLIRAAEKYNCETGHRFSTYAYNWIMQSCRRGDEEMGAIIRFPSNIKEQMTAIIRERASIKQKTGREPSRQQLADRLQMDLPSLEDVMSLGNLSLSTSSTVAGEESTLTVEDILIGEIYPGPESAAGNAELKALLERRLSTLKPLERQVITRRWGLDSQPASTRKQLATQLSVSIEWIRQLENTALGKLKKDPLLRAAGRDFIQ